MERKIFLFKQNHHKHNARFRKKGTGTGDVYSKTMQTSWKTATENIFKPAGSPNSITGETFMDAKNDTDFSISGRRIHLRITLKRKGNTKVQKKELFKYKKDGTKADNDTTLNIINGKITSYKTTGSFKVLTATNGNSLTEKTAYDAISDTDIHNQTGSNPAQKLAAGGVFTVKEQWTSPNDWLKWTGASGGANDKLSAVLNSTWYEDAKDTSKTDNNNYGSSSSNSQI